VFEARVKLNLFIPLYLVLLQTLIASVFIEVEEHVIKNSEA
jgi:hypothetical protein